MIRPATKRSMALIAFADTEGVTSANGVWSLTLIYKALASYDLTNRRFKFEKSVFHMQTFNSTTSKPDTERPFKAHRSGMQFLADSYNADAIFMFFHNAAHDRKQLNGLLDTTALNVYFVDTIPFIKKLIDRPKYNLNDLAASYGIRDNQVHESLEDTQDLFDVMTHAAVDDEYFNVFKKRLSVTQIARNMASMNEAERIQRVVDHPKILTGLLFQPEQAVPTANACSPAVAAATTKVAKQPVLTNAELTQQVKALQEKLAALALAVAKQQQKQSSADVAPEKKQQKHPNHPLNTILAKRVHAVHDGYVFFSFDGITVYKARVGFNSTKSVKSGFANYSLARYDDQTGVYSRIRPGEEKIDILTRAVKWIS